MISPSFLFANNINNYKTMLYYNFKNFEEFKERFGMVEHGNGVKSRRNKVLLSFIKNPMLLREARETGDYSLLRINNMTELKQEMWRRIAQSSAQSESKPHTVCVLGRTLYSNRYSTDASNGLCEDGDFRCIRYINHENEESRVYKMKAGKFLRNLILETDFGQTLNEQVILYLCEDFTQEWEVFTRGQLPENTLHVDKDFRKIYSQRDCDGNFCSCMTSRDLHYFYQDAVDANAAYLTNAEGKVIARCVIYNKCHDEAGNIWRLAERQYSTDCNDVLKRALVDALIRGGHIDGYKQVGYDCHNSRGFVDLEGNSLECKKFWIECNLGVNDTLSYQDSFKWYDINKGIAYNYEDVPYDYCLDTTEGSIDGDDYDGDAYDSYHDRYCYDVCTVYVNGHEYTCDEDDLDDFLYIDGEYHHKDDVCYCADCGRAFVCDDSTSCEHSDLTNEYYCCKECLETAEAKFKASHTYCDYDGCWYENTSASLTQYLSWDEASSVYVPKTITRKALWDFIHTFRFLLIDGIPYDQIDVRTWRPYEVAVA